MGVKQRKKTGALRFILATIVFFAVIIVAAVAVRNGGLDFRKMWNRVAGDKAEEFYYDNNSGGAFAAVGDGFAALSGFSLTVFDEAGDKTGSRLVGFTTPEISTGGKYAAAWELGGKDVILFTESGIDRAISVQNPIISVSVNTRGYVCIAAEEPGYGGSATVYNRNGKALFKWYSGANYVLDAKLRDSSEMLVLTIGENGSELIQCRITSESEEARYAYDGVILEADFTENGVTAISDKELIFLDKGFSEKSRYSFEGKTLDAYSLGTTFTALVVGDYQVGGTRRLVTLSNGEVIAESDVPGDIISMDMEGTYIALLYLGSVEVYTYRLAAYASFTPPAGAERVIMRADGSLIAAGSYSAKIFVPETENK